MNVVTGSLGREIHLLVRIETSIYLPLTMYKFGAHGVLIQPASRVFHDVISPPFNYEGIMITLR